MRLVDAPFLAHAAPLLAFRRPPDWQQDSGRRRTLKASREIARTSAPSGPAVTVAALFSAVQILLNTNHQLRHVDDPLLKISNRKLSSSEIPAERPQAVSAFLNVLAQVSLKCFNPSRRLSLGLPKGYLNGSSTGPRR